VRHSWDVSLRRDIKMSLHATGGVESFDRRTRHETISRSVNSVRRASLATCRTPEDNVCRQYVDSLDEGFR